jgi:hypothetical protein
MTSGTILAVVAAVMFAVAGKQPASGRNAGPRAT